MKLLNVCDLIASDFGGVSVLKKLGLLVMEIKHIPGPGVK